MCWQWRRPSFDPWVGKIPWRRERLPVPGGLQSVGSGRIRHNSATNTFTFYASQVALVVRNPPANAGDVRDKGSVPGSGRSPVAGHGNPPQYSCLESPMDRQELGWLSS